jgi:membrane-associated phospholipid phosphatase
MQLTGEQLVIKEKLFTHSATDTGFRTTVGEKKVVGTLLTIGVLTLIFATFFDQNVSHLLLDQNSIFGNLFQNYADGGAQVVSFTALEVLAWYAWNRFGDNIAKYLVTGGLLAMAFNQMLSFLQDTLSYTFSMLHNLAAGVPMGVANNTSAVANYPESLRWGLAVILTFVISLIIRNWLATKDDAELQRLLLVAVVGVLVVFVATTTISEMKTLWGRFRPYEVAQLAGSAQGGFTPWFHLNGATGHNSFPSGHTMSGWLFLYLTMFVSRNNLSLQKKMTIFGLAMGILTGLSRVRIGAHWLSDVTVSSIIVGLIIFGASRLIGQHFVEKQDTNAL